MIINNVLCILFFFITIITNGIHEENKEGNINREYLDLIASYDGLKNELKSVTSVQNQSFFTIQKLIDNNKSLYEKWNDGKQNKNQASNLNQEEQHINAEKCNIYFFFSVALPTILTFPLTETEKETHNDAIKTYFNNENNYPNLFFNTSTVNTSGRDIKEKLEKLKLLEETHRKINKDNFLNKYVNCDIKTNENKKALIDNSSAKEKENSNALKIQTNKTGNRVARKEQSLKAILEGINKENRPKDICISIGLVVSAGGLIYLLYDLCTNKIVLKYIKSLFYNFKLYLARRT